MAPTYRESLRYFSTGSEDRTFTAMAVRSLRVSVTGKKPPLLVTGKTVNEVPYAVSYRNSDGVKQRISARISGLHPDANIWTDLYCLEGTEYSEENPWFSALKVFENSTVIYAGDNETTAWHRLCTLLANYGYAPSFHYDTIGPGKLPPLDEAGVSHIAAKVVEVAELMGSVEADGPKCGISRERIQRYYVNMVVATVSESFKQAGRVWIWGETMSAGSLMGLPCARFLKDEAGSYPRMLLMDRLFKAGRERFGLLVGTYVRDVENWDDGRSDDILTILRRLDKYSIKHAQALEQVRMFELTRATRADGIDRTGKIFAWYGFSSVTEGRRLQRVAMLHEIAGLGGASTLAFPAKTMHDVSNALQESWKIRSEERGGVHVHRVGLQDSGCTDTRCSGSLCKTLNSLLTKDVGTGATKRWINGQPRPEHLTAPVFTSTYELSKGIGDGVAVVLSKFIIKGRGRPVGVDRTHTLFSMLRASGGFWFTDFVMRNFRASSPAIKAGETILDVINGSLLRPHHLPPTSTLCERRLNKVARELNAAVNNKLPGKMFLSIDLAGDSPSDFRKLKRSEYVGMEWLCQAIDVEDTDRIPVVLYGTNLEGKMHLMYEVDVPIRIALQLQADVVDEGGMEVELTNGLEVDGLGGSP